MARPVNKKELYRELAKEFGLKISQVELAVKCQFRFVKKAMESNRFPQVRLPYFGRFWVKKRRLEYLQQFGLRTPDEE